MLSRLKFEISPLVNEILDQLPAEVWTSETTTFLDPAIGGGQFIHAIEQRLRSVGHSDDNINGRVYGCENSKLSVQYAKNKYKLVATLGVGDFLTKDFTTMKFDVVVGNPPFSEKAKASDKLWAKFIAKAMPLINQDGILAFITPSGWTSSTNMAYSLLKNKIITANFSSDVSKSFGGTGGTQRFAYFVASSKENKNTPVCIFDEGKLVIDPTETPYAPQKSSSGHSYMIAQKMFSSSTPVHKWERIDYADSTKAVVVPMAKSANYVIKYEDDSFDGSRYKLKCNASDGKAIASNLNLKLYRNLRWVLRSGPALAGNFKQLPIPTTKMTDADLYKHFNLTQAEIDYIEANVK
jgi:hypothetical protein